MLRRIRRPRFHHAGGSAPIDARLAGRLEECFAGVTPVAYPAGTLIYTPDDPAEHLFLLREGSVELFRVTSSGKRLVTREVREGTIFGVMGLLGQSMQGNFAQAVRDSLILTLSREQMMDHLLVRPTIALQVLEVVGSRLTEAEERLLEVAYSPVPVRLARFLLAHADPATGILKDITQEEIGDAIGALRQTVTETLTTMRRDGLIQTGLRRIDVLAPDRLQEIASR